MEPHGSTCGPNNLPVFALGYDAVIRLGIGATSRRSTTIGHSSSARLVDRLLDSRLRAELLAAEWLKSSRPCYPAKADKDSGRRWVQQITGMGYF